MDDQRAEKDRRHHQIKNEVNAERNADVFNRRRQVKTAHQNQRIRVVFPGKTDSRSSDQTEIGDRIPDKQNDDRSRRNRIVIPENEPGDEIRHDRQDENADADKKEPIRLS